MARPCRLVRQVAAAALGCLAASTTLVACSDDERSTPDESSPEPALVRPAPNLDLPEGAPDSGWDGPRFGSVYHGMWDMSWADRAELLDKLVATGATWVRVGVQWAAVQPRRPTADDPGWGTKWGVPKADRVIDQAYERGLDVSVTLLRTPDWANGGRGPEYLPSDPGSYARAVEWMANRYRDQVSAWEVYNEPNHDGHLRASPKAYTRLLCQAYPAIHRGDPTADVIFGGTSGNDYEYIDAAYRAGAKGCFDVLATHPYNADYSPRVEARSHHRWWFHNITLVRDVMIKHRDRATPVWFTEVGWSTHENTPTTPSSKRGVTYEEQARYAVQLLRITKREYGYVDRIAWYTARNQETGDLENDNFGLFTLDLEPKPAAIRLREFFASR